MRIKAFIYIFLYFTLLPIKTFALIPDGQTITSLLIKDKAGKTTQNYPLTFGHVFKKGDVKDSISVKLNGVVLPTQCDIKRHWSDGSIKHAVISVILPKIEANQNLTLELIAGGTNTNSSGWLTKDEILATNVESKIELTNISGSQNPSTASVSLRQVLSKEDKLSYWLKGKICTEILADTPITPNDNLHARWEARFYPKTNFGPRISTIVESVNLSALGNSAYSVSLKYGYPTSVDVYHYNNYSHPYGSRWRKTFWIGEPPPEVEIHYDLNYLISTELIPPIDPSITIPSDYINSLYNIYKTKNGEIRGGDDIDGSGNIYRAMPMVGGRDDLGLLPTWAMIYLITFDNKAREMVLGNGDIAGQVGSLHYREGDPTKEFYKKAAVSINSRPMVRLMDLKNDIPPPVGETPDNPNSWNPDRNHQPSLVYIPYLITGEHYYAEELEFWASYDIGYSHYARNGQGITFDFSSYFNGYNAGIIHDETRGVAWSLRNINDAVIILPESENFLINYFKEKLNNNFKWLEMANSQGHQGVHFIIVSRRSSFAGWPHLDAPWQHDFNVIVLNDIIRKQEGVYDLNALKKLRDYLGYFTVGRFTNDPEYNKWDGVAYYVPLVHKDGTPIPEGDWADFYNTCKEFWKDDPSHSGGGPYKNGFRTTWINYPESYLYVAKGAIAGLTHLPKGEDAYNFIANYIKKELIFKKPQWGALVPSSIGNHPIILDIQIK